MEHSGPKVKELTARLLVCMDGSANGHNEIVCRWDEKSKPLSGQLIMVIQDGEAFGVKGKRLPSLSLSFSSGGPNSKTETNISALVTSNLPDKIRMAASEMSLSGKQVVYEEISPPPRRSLNPWSLGDSEEALIEASKDGAVVLGVIVKWKQ